jgi:pantoate--beta-alanine ligase
MSDVSKIIVLRSNEEMRFWVQAQQQHGKKVGFIPTMGALHEGHLSLVEEAAKHADAVLASIFVNPSQFAPDEDFDSYPRAETEDLEKLVSAGCHAAYCPSPVEIYPEGDATTVFVDGLSQKLEGEHRPHFFGGVATVVTKLFIRVMPDLAVFGEKDFQQLQIIKRMTQDLGLNIDIIGAPTIREHDGLAMSSRNRYLSEIEREKAGKWAQSLATAATAIANGNSISKSLETAKSQIEDAGLTPIDYVEVRTEDGLNVLPDDIWDGMEPVRVLGAAWMGKTRLIDNRAV